MMSADPKNTVEVAAVASGQMIMMTPGGRGEYAHEDAPAGGLGDFFGDSVGDHFEFLLLYEVRRFRRGSERAP
jgi:hypothetical protein